MAGCVEPQASQALIYPRDPTAMANKDEDISEDIAPALLVQLPWTRICSSNKVMRNETFEIPATMSDEAGLDRDPEHLSLQSHSLVPTEKPHSPRVGIA